MPTQAKNCGQKLELLNVTSQATNPRDLSSHRHRVLPLRYLEPHRHTNIGAQFNCKSYTNSHPFRQTNILTFRQPRQYFKNVTSKPHRQQIQSLFHYRTVYHTNNIVLYPSGTSLDATKASQAYKYVSAI